MAELTNTTLKCPILYTLEIVSGKWKWIILYKLNKYGPLRYGELKREIPAITHKKLSQDLRELETEKLVQRKSYHQIPPKVEYLLTEKGKALVPVLDCMCKWGEKHICVH